MGEALLIRVVKFRARHHYWRSDWSAAENRRVFGPQAEPHEHDWRVELQVAGPIRAETGWAVDLGELDGIVGRVVGELDGEDLNAVVPEVSVGAMQPSTEEMARWLFRRLVNETPAPARLVRVKLFESPDLGACYPP